jgi:hypothetical protein
MTLFGSTDFSPFGANGLTISTVALSSGAWLFGQVVPATAAQGVEPYGIALGLVSLAALLVRSYTEVRVHKLDAEAKLREAEADARSAVREKAEQTAAYARAMAEVARLESDLKYAQRERDLERQACATGICPFPKPDGAARCDHAAKPLPLQAGEA